MRHERRTDVELAGYTRERVSETQQLFPTIANPVIVMYVYPHMVGDMPIPGYSTGIRMYDKDQFAMPGEK